MREFNTFGPVDPTIHYHVNRVDIKADLRQRIEKGRYLTFSAARQTGKTTLFREVLAELEATGEYVGILLDFEGLNDLT
jgi:predicted AAA+ superfamily ATPase